MFNLLSRQTPEEKRKKKIESTTRTLLNLLEDDYDQLTVQEQVDALLQCNKIFREGKEKELEALVEKQLEIAQAIKVLNSLV